MGLLPSLPPSGPPKAWLALGLLNEAVVAFSHRDNLDDLWACVCEQARWLLPFQRMAVLLWEEEPRFRVAQRYSRGNLGGPLVGSFEASQDPLGPLLNKSEAGWVEGPWPEVPPDVFQDWVFSTPAPQALLGVPIQYEHRRIGHLLFGLAAAPPEDRALLTGLASTYALHACLRFALIVANEERQAAERAHQESEERLKLALRVARMGLWEWNRGRETVLRSEGFDRIFGLPPSVQEVAPSAYLERVLPEDLPLLKVAYYQGSSFDVGFRVARPNGEIKRLVTKGKILRNESGAPMQIIGVLQEQPEGNPPGLSPG